jgi:outer membrane protein OmpA-like peptidoglycan-associated protein
MQIGVTNSKDVFVADTLRKPLVQAQEVPPENLVIYFAFDKYEFITNAKADKYFEESKVYLDQNAQAWLHITGYTDAIGSDEYNQALGYRRAQSLQYYFKSKGMSSGRITIESKGEKEPADDNNTIAGRANNRVTAVTIKNKL